MKAVDKTNIKWGISTIKYGSSGLEQRWRMERATLSPRYTTNWDEILSEIELTTAYEVSIESDESGKKIYSNYILRNAETRRRLQGNAEYESLKEHLDFLGREGRNLQTEIDILDRRFCILEQMVTLTMVEGHILSHYKDVIDCERNN